MDLPLSAELVTKLFPAVPGLPSSTFEAPRRKCLWDSSCWPRVWGFAVPPESWRSNSIPPEDGWPLPLCIVSKSAICSFGISSFPRSKWMNFGRSLKKTPKSHCTDHPRRPLSCKEGRGRSLGTTWIWRAFASKFRLRLASLVGNRNLYGARRLLRKIQGCFGWVASVIYFRLPQALYGCPFRSSSGNGKSPNLQDRQDVLASLNVFPLLI